jgi:hypothetical protein
MIVNYTIPAGITAAEWQVKWYNEENGTVLENYSLNTTNCNLSTAYYNLMIQVYPNETEGYASISCQQSAGNWKPLMQMGNPSNITDPRIYEEGMWWNTTSPAVVADLTEPGNTTYTYANRSQNVTFSCTGDVDVYGFDVNDSFDNSSVAWGLLSNDTTSTVPNEVFAAGQHTLTLTCWNGTAIDTSSVSFVVSAPPALNYTVDYLIWSDYSDYNVSGGDITVADLGVYRITYNASAVNVSMAFILSAVVVLLILVPITWLTTKM